MSSELNESEIDAIFASLNQCHLPGVAVGIAIAGRPVYRKGFGLANMELPQPLSQSIRMRIGSITKHFTSLAYLLLCESGHAAIDDSIGKYLPELHPVAHAVTMRELMGHLGGLRDAYDISLLFSGAGRPIESSEMLALYREFDDVNSAPGIAWNYNNGGYVILSEVIERITGNPLEHVFREQIFERVAMYDSLLRRWDTDVLPNSATLHNARPGGGYTKSGMGMALGGEGGIVSTVDDMLRWLAHLDSPVVGSYDTWKLIKSPQRLANGELTGYGFGLVSDRYRGVDTIEHGGNVLGGNSQMTKVPSAKLDVIVMSNRYDVSASQLTHQILDACLPSLDPIGEIIDQTESRGVFLSSSSGRVIQLFSEGKQQIASIDGWDLPVQRTDKGVLRPVSTLSVIRQTIEPLGSWATPSAVTFCDVGNVDHLTVQEGPSNASVNPIAGSYRSSSTGSRLTILSTPEGPLLITTGNFGTARFTLECLAERIWRARSTTPLPWGGVLSFKHDNTSVQFASYRTRAVTFSRIA